MFECPGKFQISERLWGIDAVPETKQVCDVFMQYRKMSALKLENWDLRSGILIQIQDIELTILNMPPKAVLQPRDNFW